ncbi:hypothetical protein N7510_001826 [Penicillium lagena]|uniref:uncharacterized protein n=1 Tax=Penicillium lagena TaxID=94218 RepID=UPI0025416EA1|nr:uncharacterized protein N7510_001826 [Penicillium lagena]KAJ5625517.1 hypothetical protein N7510_001826 [Penicillium lagena]
MQIDYKDPTPLSSRKCLWHGLTEALPDRRGFCTFLLVHVHAALWPLGMMMDDFGTTSVANKRVANCRYKSLRLTDRSDFLTLFYMAPTDRRERALPKRRFWRVYLPALPEISIRALWVPIESSPILWTYGLPYFAVVEDKFILCGDDRRGKIQHQLHSRREGSSHQRGTPHRPEYYPLGMSLRQPKSSHGGMPFGGSTTKSLIDTSPFFFTLHHLLRISTLSTS